VQGYNEQKTLHPPGKRSLASAPGLFKHRRLRNKPETKKERDRESKKQKRKNHRRSEKTNQHCKTRAISRIPIVKNTREELKKERKSSTVSTVKSYIHVTSN